MVSNSSSRLPTLLHTPDTPMLPINPNQEPERESFLPSSARTNDERDKEYGISLFSTRHIWHRISSLYHDNIGLLLVGASQAFFAFMNLFVKLLTALDNPVHTLELIWIRMFITFFCCLTYMYLTKVEHLFFGPPGVRWLLVIRGVSGFFGLFGTYFSLQYLSLSDATVLTFLAPSFTCITGYLFLKEPLTRRETLATLFSLFGVVLIARPASLFGSGESDVPNDISSQQRLIAVSIALVGVLGATGAYTSIRAIGTRAHTMHSLTYFSFYCVMVSTILMIVLKVPVVVPVQGVFVLFLVLIGIFGFIAQSLLVMGLQRETASRGTMGVYIQILFAGALEQFFLHAKPSSLSILGAITILSSAIYVAITKQRQPGAPGRKRVHWGDDLEDLEPIGNYSSPRISLETYTGSGVSKSDTDSEPPSERKEQER